MSGGCGPDDLLVLLPEPLRGATARALAAMRVARLPPGVGARALGGATRVDVGPRTFVFRDDDRSNAARKVRALVSALLEARERENRSALIALAGATEDEPPAWAYRCSRMLRSALAAARRTPDWLLGEVRDGRNTTSDPIEIAGLRRRDGTPLPPARLSVSIPPGDRIVARIELSPEVTFRDRSRPELLVSALPATLVSQLKGLPSGELLDHPLLARADAVVASAYAAGKRTGVRLDQPWTTLARLPAPFAAVLRANRADVLGGAWRRGA